MRRFVIIGAGEAGTRAALALRQAGAGEVVLIGAEPGLPYERPPLSKPKDVEVTIRPIATTFDGIDARFGVSVERIDRTARSVALADGSDVAYDRLLLATGAQPRTLPFDAEGVALTLRTHHHARAILDRIRPSGHAAILGAGLIGLELAAGLRLHGMAVTVLEAAPRALGRVLPETIAAELVARHRQAGVRILFDAKVTALKPGRVALDCAEDLSADPVIAAIGVAPDTRLAEAAGLACVNGILVDASLRTADPDIFAAGDCAAIDHPGYGRFRFETWRNACDQGAMVARAMMGEDVAFAIHPWFWTDQYELGLQMVGLHDPARMTVRRELAGGGFILFELDQQGMLRAASGLGPGQAVARDIRLAEMMIQKGARPAPGMLGDAQMPLKTLLRAA